jgi:hypothetical protein
MKWLEIGVVGDTPYKSYKESVAPFRKQGLQLSRVYAKSEGWRTGAGADGTCTLFFNVDELHSD